MQYFRRFNMPTTIITSFSSKSNPPWAHALPGTSERAEKDSIVSILPSRHARTMAPKLWIYTVQD